MLDIQKALCYKQDSELDGLRVEIAKAFKHLQEFQRHEVKASTPQEQVKQLELFATKFKEDYFQQSIINLE
jgi:hypothetical protein